MPKWPPISNLQFGHVTALYHLHDLLISVISHNTKLHIQIWRSKKHTLSFGLIQISSALPHRGCQCYVCKKSGIPLAVFQIFPGTPEWENKKVWILSAGVCWGVCGCVCVLSLGENRIYVQKAWKSRTIIFYQRKKVWKSNFLCGGRGKTVFLEQLIGCCSGYKSIIFHEQWNGHYPSICQWISMNEVAKCAEIICSSFDNLYSPPHQMMRILWFASLNLLFVFLLSCIASYCTSYYL